MDKLMVSNSFLWDESGDLWDILREEKCPGSGLIHKCKLGTLIISIFICKMKVLGPVCIGQESPEKQKQQGVCVYRDTERLTIRKWVT